MILEKSNTASVPARSELERNESSTRLFVWRFTQRNGMRFRAASHLGEFSVWREDGGEREVFRINLGILEEVVRSARSARRTVVMDLPELRDLTEREVRKIWKRSAENPELRFCATTRKVPAHLGGWHHCLDKAAELLEGLGREVPWSEEALLAPED
jgi:hypothetical protein